MVTVQLQHRHIHESSNSACNSEVPHEHAPTAEEELLQSNSSAADHNHASSADVAAGDDLENASELTTGLVQGLDPAGDRRKRRKISVEPRGVSSAAVSNQEGTESNKGGQEVPIVIGSDPITPSAPQSPKKRRGRPPKSSTQKAANVEQKASVTDLSTNTGSLAVVDRSPRTNRTLRTNNLRVNINGTLVLEPQNAAKTVSPRISGPRTSQRSSKNLALKNGKFAQTLVVRIKYHTQDFGRQIEDVLQAKVRIQPLKKQPTTTVTGIQARAANGPTHPFFLGKPQQQATNGPADLVGAESKQGVLPSDDMSESKKPVAWTDIVFKRKRTSTVKGETFQKPAWPPHYSRHVNVAARVATELNSQPTRSKKQKFKALMNQIGEGEDIFAAYVKHFADQSTLKTDLRLPLRLHCTAQEALDQYLRRQTTNQEVKAIKMARNRTLIATGTFDCGEASGPLPWTQQYGPTMAEEVLQPDCYLLYDWLRSLAVHHVKQGLVAAHAKHPAKRHKKVKKKRVELDDFIVDNDDDDQESQKVKNAILIVGPNGCGKTASVHAVARQLGFEVFEIHAGMKRGQKDIFDKVGDMAQNHMVQGGRDLSRASSVVNDTDVSLSQEEPDQSSLSAFLASNKLKPRKEVTRPSTPRPSKEQKQSLILFEEVDQIFEDDRGFWSGVQELIQNSKRPVVMTCNSLLDVPLDELDLYATLTYTAPPSDVVAEYLAYVAAAEGHIIRPQAIETLYHSKGDDLRATITELDFWCQMTVGSQKGGLDWYPTFEGDGRIQEQKSRVFSKDTFSEGQNILPSSSADLVDDLQLMEQCSDGSLDQWLEVLATSVVASKGRPQALVIDRVEMLSDIQMLNLSGKYHMAAEMCSTGLAVAADVRQFMLAEACKPRDKDDSMSFDCLQALSIERPVFPPAQGRLAPSLEAPRSVIASDIAPYVRSIAAFDHRLEQQRDELSSSQGRKTRTTRAARAAAEGGDKASTRRERWFPAQLDLEAVLKTGGGWPQWTENAGDIVEDLVMSESGSPEHIVDDVLE